MLSLEAPDDESQTIAEFIDQKFVETYGIRKLAKGHLHNLILGLSVHSPSRRRLKLFRSLTDLVPGDTPHSHATAEFYQLLLRTLVDAIAEDHLSGVSAALFWRHFGRDEVRAAETSRSWNARFL